MKYFLSLLVILLITACSSASNQAPLWINQPKNVYPESEYLSAVGEGRNNEQAKQVALANLSRIFSVSLAEEQIDKSTFSSELGKTNTEVSRYISAKADQELKGATIKETYQSLQGQFYAVAVLKKMPTARAFRDSINQLDRAVAGNLSYAKNTAPNFFTALKALEQAHMNQQQRENDNRNLLIVAPIGIASSITSFDIEQLIKKSLSSLSFKIDSDDKFMQQQLSASASNLGVTVANNSSMILSGKVDKQPVYSQGGWFWLRGNIHINVNDGDNTTQQMIFPYKVSAQQEAMLNSRIEDYIAQNLDNYILKTMFKK
jgi:hypothetical protein